MPSCTPMGSSEKPRRSYVSEIAGPARWLTGLGNSWAKHQEGGLFFFHCCHSFISSSSPFPPPNTHRHTSHPTACLSCDVSHSPSGGPPACPTGKMWPEPYLAPWPMALHLHQPPSAPQSICPTCWSNFILSHINTSLNSTLDYHVLSPDVPPNEKAVSTRVGDLIPSPLCSSFKPLQCVRTTQGASWTFRNVLELFTSSLNLLYGQPRTLSVHESWVGSGGL